MTTLPAYLYSQLICKLPYPSHDFTSQTIIVTGANTGLGLEAARHFVRLNAAKVILAVRSPSKGLEAAADIEASTRRSGVVEVYQLDLGSYASVKAFAARVAELPRLDAVVENAGIATADFEMLEDNESTITVNVVSTTMLALLLLPILRKSAERWNVLPRLAIVSSDVHLSTRFPEWKTENAFATLNDPKTANMSDRYNISKLLELLFVRALAKRMRPSPQVLINAVNPGLCHSELTRSVRGLLAFELSLLKSLVARTTEEGSRTLVHAVSVGWEAQGQYMSDCRVREDAVSKFVRSEEGEMARDKVWAELGNKLEGIVPGIMEGI